MNALIDNYSREELENIVAKSLTMREVIARLGYKTVNGSNTNTVKKRLIQYNISTEHFTILPKEERNINNVFCINSTARQSTLRRWYKRIKPAEYCEICGQESTWNDLPLTFTLDHINGDNHDNRFENLRWICPNCGSQLPTFAGRNNKKHDNYIPVAVIKKSERICPVCNINRISANANQCKECNDQKRRKNIPSKQVLEELIYKYPFTEIGKMYGVSDNAVRKWCKSYELPYRYGELHQIVS